MADQGENTHTQEEGGHSKVISKYNSRVLHVSVCLSPPSTPAVSVPCLRKQTGHARSLKRSLPTLTFWDSRDSGRALDSFPDFQSILASAKRGLESVSVWELGGGGLKAVGDTEPKREACKHGTARHC